MKYYIEFPDSQNLSKFVNGTNKGADSIDIAISFSSTEEAELYIEQNNITEEASIIDETGEPI